MKKGHNRSLKLRWLESGEDSFGSSASHCINVLNYRADAATPT